MGKAESISAYGASWAEPDESKRRELLETAWADDGVYCDPIGRAEGREALVAHIGGFIDAMAGHSIEITSGIDEHAEFARFGWRMLDPDGAVAMEGIDFLSFDADGRIKQLVGFIGPLPQGS